MIRTHHIPTIAGNYDIGVGMNSSDCGCAYKTKEEKAWGEQSIACTNALVTEEVRAYLRHLPRHFRITAGNEQSPYELLMVHGSPRRVNEYLFEDRPDSSFLRMMLASHANVLLFGHTHRPFHRVIQASHEEDTRYYHAINIGSVDKPKDGDPRACYVLLRLHAPASPFRPDSVEVTFVRVPYDVERTAQAIEQSSLPDIFADQLRKAC